jgi:transcription antitermination factor NusG
VTEVRRGKKSPVERKFFPGYVLAKLEMNDDVYHLVKNTPKVTGFLGIMGKPQPISEAEAAAHPQHQGEEAAAAPKAQDQRRLRDRRQRQGHQRAVRELLGHRRRARFRQEPGQGLDLDLRARDAAGAGLRGSRTFQIR